MIDWTKPCETTEDPPRPVRVLVTDIKGSAYPVIIAYDNPKYDCEIIDRRPISGIGNPSIRNVAPKPVRHEVFINLYDDGTLGSSLGGYPSSEAADGAAHPFKNRVECRRIVWNSDGSPVEGESLGDLSIYQMENHGLRERVATIESDNSDLERDRDAWKAKAEALQAEVDRQKPVVDAAVAWDDSTRSGEDDALLKLSNAVRFYQSKQAPADPVKNCATCRFSERIEICMSCQGSCLSNWEPRR